MRRGLPNARVVNVDRHLLPGKAIDTGLTGLIETSGVFVHVSSLASRQSLWVAQEVEFARAREQRGEIYFVTLLADADVPSDGELDGSRKYLRYDRDRERALGDLVEAIARVAPSALIPPVDSRVVSYRRTASALFLALVTTMLLVGANIGINSPTAVGWLHLLHAVNPDPQPHRQHSGAARIASRLQPDDVNVDREVRDDCHHGVASRASGLDWRSVW